MLPLALKQNKADAGWKHYEANKFVTYITDKRDKLTCVGSHDDIYKAVNMCRRHSKENGSLFRYKVHTKGDITLDRTLTLDFPIDIMGDGSEIKKAKDFKGHVMIDCQANYVLFESCQFPSGFSHGSGISADTEIKEQ